MYFRCLGIVLTLNIRNLIGNVYLSDKESSFPRQRSSKTEGRVDCVPHQSRVLLFQLLSLVPVITPGFSSRCATFCLMQKSYNFPSRPPWSGTPMPLRWQTRCYSAHTIKCPILSNKTSPRYPCTSQAAITECQPFQEFYPLCHMLYILHCS